MTTHATPPSSPVEHSNLRKLAPLLFGLGAFTIVVGALLAWAVFGGETGRTRGWVIRNQVSETVTLSLEDGQSAEVETRRQTTFVLEREDFPQRVVARTLAGDVVADRVFTYAEIAAEEFRWDLDRAGFFPTQVVRTVVP